MYNSIYEEIGSSFDESLAQSCPDFDSESAKAARYAAEEQERYADSGTAVTAEESRWEDEMWADAERAFKERQQEQSTEAPPPPQKTDLDAEYEWYEQQQANADAAKQTLSDNGYRETPPKRPLEVFSCEELSQRIYASKPFLVKGLLSAGLTILAGSPKVGKSWLVMHLCMQIAKGEPFLGLDTKRSGVLYIALEDDERRLQKRMFTISEEMPANFYMTTRCSRMSDDDEFRKELLMFWIEHKDVRLIVIDTLQMVREQGRDMSYANDYSEISQIKSLADTLNIAVLVVHHTRKQGDSDYMNEISGTNGIAGSADTLMVLKKEKRSSRDATLSCTGRDIEDREITMHLDRETCVWQKTGDNHDADAEDVPREIIDLVGFMMDQKAFKGTNTEFAAAFSQHRRHEINPSQLKRIMNRYRFDLLDRGVRFESIRDRNSRILIVSYHAKPEDGEKATYSSPTD